MGKKDEGKNEGKKKQFIIVNPGFKLAFPNCID